MPTLDLKKFGVVLSTFALLAFTACFLWRFTLPPDLQAIHLDNLRVAQHTIQRLRFGFLDAAQGGL